MPNWVTINMSVYGKADKVKKFVKDNTAIIPVFDMDGKQKIKDDGTPETYEQKLSFQCAVPLELKNLKYRVYPDAEGHLSVSKEYPITDPDGRTSYFDWYSFNCDKWGTKWDADSVEVTVDEADDGTAEASYSFNTAWNFPEEWFRVLASKWVDLEILVYASEESHAFYLVGRAYNGVVDLDYQDYDEAFPTPVGAEYVELIKGQMADQGLDPDKYDLTNLDESDDEVSAAIYINIIEDLVHPSNSDYEVYMEDPDGFKQALEKYKK